MDRPLLLLLAAGLLLACATTAPRPTLPPGRIVDLTHAFDASTIYWPTEKGFELERGFAGITERGYYYEAHRFRAAEHGGTHVDAPIHFAEDRRTLDQVPVEQLIGPAVVVDVSAASARDPDYRIGVEDLLGFEQRYGPIPDGAVVLLRTGFAARWPDRAAYLGTSELGPEAVPKLHFPGLHPAAARWLATQRRVGAVGIDTASIDTGQSVTFDSHRVLFDRNIPALENVARLNELPATGATVIALPMKIRGGSGGPVRIVAIVPENG